MAPSDYPEWFYFPSSERPPLWVEAFLGAVAAARASIESTSVEHLTSDVVLSYLRPGLEGLGYEVETDDEGCSDQVSVDGVAACAAPPPKRR